jgi:hypothetical protein
LLDSDLKRPIHQTRELAFFLGKSMERLHVFVDEYGDPHLDVSKDGVSSTYIVTALCVRSRDLEQVLCDAEVIRKKYFQTGEMKSSLIGPNDSRRLKVVQDLSKLKGFVIAFCAQKARADKNTGLNFKKSFLKFFANALYKRVTRCADDVVILADGHGSQDFQREMLRYLESRYLKPDLFSTPPTFGFEDSKLNVLLQAADVFAGSLARLYDEKKASDRDGKLKEILGECTSLTLWPSGQELGSVPTAEHLSEDDERVRGYCLRRVGDYLERSASFRDDRDEAARVIFLDALVAHHTLDVSGDYLSTKALKREISSRLGEPISDHRFRSVVVAKLRDADVIISSCNKGYRLPTCVNDVVEFASFANSLIPPMVVRICRARRGIREATLGRVDMLADRKLSQLKTIAESIED